MTWKHIDILTEFSKQNDLNSESVGGGGQKTRTIVFTAAAAIQRRTEHMALNRKS